jgi:glutathione synthase/RimK-type ligase-like ATP-grasp enzyme
MKICLLAHHPDSFASKRLLQELDVRGEGCQVLRPSDVRWRLPWDGENFTLTFNRLAAVESGPFERALARLPCWGLQVNPWELREALWDKAHQALWLGARGVAPVPTFMHQGRLTREDPAWRAFAAHGAGAGWVLKFNRGQRGVGVHLVPDETALLSWLETFYRMGDQDFLVQPRLLGQEWRLTLLDGEPWALLNRAPCEHGLGNFAQGGSAREVSWGQAPRELVELASRVAVPGAALALDILLGPHGVRVLDVNTVPGVEQLEQVTGRNFTGDWVSKALIL